MRARTLFLGLTGIASWVAYGCGGEPRSPDVGSGARAGEGAHAGTSPGGRGGTAGSSGSRGATGGKAGTTGDAGAGAVTGDAGSSDMGGHGGTAGPNVAGRGGHGGTAGSNVAGGGGRGGTAGSNASGGAGSGGAAGSCEVPSETGDPIDRCCVGDAWGWTEAYYRSDPAACGEPRGCEVEVGVYRCQDIPSPERFVSQCCADGLWHLVKGEEQYEQPANGSGNPTIDQRSPLCGGTTWPSSHALHFDGASYLDLAVPASVQLLEIWFRTSSATGPLIASTSSAHRLYLSEGRLCFSPDENGEALCTVESSFADGAWHHIALQGAPTSQGSTYVGLFVDETRRVEGTTGGETITGLRAGYGPLENEAFSEYFVGDLDEIRIWGADLHPYPYTDYAATRLTNAGTLGRLIGYFPLEESGMTMSAKNEAGVPIVEPFCDGLGGGGAGGGDAGPPDGTLVGFGSASSPWIAPGAF